MAFAWTFDENFEDGTTGAFNSETDANGVLNIRHWRYLLKHPYLDSSSKLRTVMPYRGAYVAEINLAGADTNQYLEETDGLDIAADGELYIRFYLYVTSDLTMAASDRFTVLTLQSAGPTDEAVIDIVNNAGTIQIGTAETGATAIGSGAFGDLTLDEWHCVELYVNLDEGGGNDGTLDFYVDNVQVGSQITSLDQGAIIQGRLGVIGVDAGSTAGKVYISEFTADDARLYPYRDRDPNPITLTKSQHVFVGPGWIEAAALLSTNADDKIVFYDTDTADTNDAEGFELELYAFTSAAGPYFFSKGCYASMSGTAPRGQVRLADNSEEGGVFGPLGRGALKSYGMRSL